MVDEKKRKAAIFLNVLVLPGLGQFMVGKRIKGIVISALTLIFLFIPLFKYAIEVFSTLRTISPTESGIARSVSTFGNAWDQSKGIIIPCLIVIGVLWIYSIVDIALSKRKGDGATTEV